MTRICQACFDPECDHIRCYMESPADHAEHDEELCIGCDRPFDESGYCADCEDYALTETVADPLKHVEPRRAA
jgi:hypothetical protein